MSQRDQQPRTSFRDRDSIFDIRHPSSFGPFFSDINDVRTVLPTSQGILERPTDTVIDHLRETDPRIVALHLPDTNPRGALDALLAARVDEDFKDKPLVAMRSIHASLDGVVRTDGLDVHDLRDILRMGEMSNRPSVNLAPYEPNTSSNQDKIHHRVIQFATETRGFRSLDLGDRSGAERVFPVILIYDPSKVHASESGNSYDFDLPTDESERASVILKAYVLDAFH